MVAPNAAIKVLRPFFLDTFIAMRPVVIAHRVLWPGVASKPAAMSQVRDRATIERRTGNYNEAMEICL
ncbi:MAG: hypothetical protein M3O74_01065 [Pseudomonadota bacterium]|jgi:hypothetical protein|uniref:Uncharacterized protein n=1 Tax=Caballeronia sordidicola TaxID=196367 RepID=A0A242MHB7_CABSO|nr:MULTISPECIES: hypothetical protein [Burkholderiaceae]MDP9152811.1 hypothetical protein [Pseudomonadota bacterium]OTP70348.1 hypothetical protein PAMC26577_27375 [Caballeronia sordidicola]OTP80527.1 hypothetical protein PAMC26510_02680 [Caballeronia sordidicola]